MFVCRALWLDLSCWVDEVGWKISPWKSWTRVTWRLCWSKSMITTGQLQDCPYHTFINVWSSCLHWTQHIASTFCVLFDVEIFLFRILEAELEAEIRNHELESIQFQEKIDEIDKKNIVVSDRTLVYLHKNNIILGAYSQQNGGNSIRVTTVPLSR